GDGCQDQEAGVHVILRALVASHAKGPAFAGTARAADRVAAARRGPAAPFGGARGRGAVQALRGFRPAAGRPLYGPAVSVRAERRNRPPPRQSTAGYGERRDP